MENTNFYQEIADLQNDITKIVKNTDNPYFKSKYSDLSAIFDEVKPKIKEHGFVLIQRVLGNILKSELIFIKTGQSIESEMELLTAKPDMQQLGSAITYARRYSLLSLLNIETEDDDGNRASGNTKTFDELETLEDFSEAIKSSKSVKQINALWYKWKEKFAEGSEEYKKLQQTSADMKTKLNNPDLKVEVR